MRAVSAIRVSGKDPGTVCSFSVWVRVVSAEGTRSSTGLMAVVHFPAAHAAAAMRNAGLVSLAWRTQVLASYRFVSRPRATPDPLPA